MPLLSYFTNILTTDHQNVILTAKFTVDAATGTVKTISGKRLAITAGVGTGALTITLPQIFKNVVCIKSHVVDTALAGMQLVPTSDVTITGSKSQFTATLAKLTGAAPAAVTTGVYTIGLEIIAAA